MLIEIDFDERLFPEPVWSSVFVTARAMRYVATHTIERIRFSAHPVTIDGHPAKILRCAVTLRVADDAQTRTFEFAPGGRWRVRPQDAAEDSAWTLFLPEQNHEYERDLIHRNELQVALLRHQLFLWMDELRRPPPFTRA